MTPQSKTLGQTRTFASMVAEKQGWKLNADQEFLESLIEGLTTNFNRYGYYLCPCRDSDGSRALDAKAICPCVWAKEDIDRHGHCFCALYLSPAFAASGNPPAGIADRRNE